MGVNQTTQRYFDNILDSGLVNDSLITIEKNDTNKQNIIKKSTRQNEYDIEVRRFVKKQRWLRSGLLEHQNNNVIQF